LAEILAHSSPPPVVIKIQDPDGATAQLALSSGSLVVAKDHQLAHDWRNYQVDPVLLADEHADRLVTNMARTGITHWESFNEPIPDSQWVIDWLIAHDLHLARRLAEHRMTLYVLGLSVGWPNESVGGKDWWAPFDFLFANWLPNMVLSVGEYFPYPSGPDEGWSYYAGRLVRMPPENWSVIGKPFIRECGQDRVENGVHLFWGNTHGDIELVVHHMQRFQELYEESGIEPIGASIFTCGTQSNDWVFADYSMHLNVMRQLWEGRYESDKPFPPVVPVPPIEPSIRVLMESGVVVTMPVKEYLRGVVPAEMPALWPMEAVKAQAIAARTYAMHAIQNPAHDNADICTTTHCQVYNPDKIHPQSDVAIEETAGVVILYEGEIIQAFYCANCGGLTRSNREVWGGDHLPYLEPVECVNPGPKNGHSVGMCQWGAHDMAELGADYPTILKYYYSCVTLSNEGEDPPPEPPPGGEDMIDPRLSAYAEQNGKVVGVKMEIMEAQTFISKWNEFRLKSGDPYFKLVNAQFLDENEAQGNTGIHISVQDENGSLMPGQVWHAYPTTRMSAANWVGAFDNGGQGAGDVFSYPSGQGEIAQGPGNFAPESPDDIGPYLVAVYTDPGCGSIASECAYGFGLPHNRHVAYALTFRICPWGGAAPDPGPDPDPDPVPVPVPPVPAPGVPVDLTGAFAVLSASILLACEKLTAKQYMEVVRLAMEGEWAD